MGKLVWLAVVVALGCKLVLGRWPWQVWRAWAAMPAPPAARARQLLGLPPGATRAMILAAHRRRLASIHPDRGGTAALVHEADAARDLLIARCATTS